MRFLMYACGMVGSIGLVILFAWFVLSVPDWWAKGMCALVTLMTISIIPVVHRSLKPWGITERA